MVGAEIGFGSRDRGVALIGGLDLGSGLDVLTIVGGLASTKVEQELADLKARMHNSKPMAG